MAKISPWSVKGVEPEAREAAKTAARQYGMTLGQWLNLTILAAAADQAVAPAGENQVTNGTRTFEDTGSSANQGYSPHRHAETSTPPFVPDPAQGIPPTEGSILGILRNPASRIDRADREPATIPAPPTSQPGHLARQLSNQGEPVKSRMAASPVVVEGAVQRLAKRLERIEAARQAHNSNRRGPLFSRDR